MPSSRFAKYLLNSIGSPFYSNLYSFIYDEYKEMLKSDVAELINAGSKGQAGSSAGGIFLKHFIEEGQEWVHLDIAGPVYAERPLIPYWQVGATGYGVRTLVNLISSFSS